MVWAQSLSDEQIAQVTDRLAVGAQQSWELGTRCEALTELNTPSFSVFYDADLPPSKNAPSSLDTVLEVAENVTSNRNSSLSIQPLFDDGSAGDPASMGVSVMLANWTNYGDGQLDYASAATQQLIYLLDYVPRTPDGAISHRNGYVQLWSDFIYMAPPFIAYYGALTDNKTLVEEAYTQVALYRNYLRVTSGEYENLWMHILLGPWNDTGLWATGNAWAAAGMLRVLATIKHSSFADEMLAEQTNLTEWVSEIHDAIYPTLGDNNLLLNYISNDTEGNFYDASSTTLMASTVYRLSVLAGVHTHIPAAEKCRKTLSSTNSTGGMAHFTSDYWLTPVVNPESFSEEGSQSPESEAFVLLMQATWEDWKSAGSTGANTAIHSMHLGTTSWSVVVSAVVSAVLAMLTLF
ncbi:hypothetical protein FISHEDRAFT_47575 [Fistulina hepatica ATCC 64428]|uniref:Six-hairpin glycosidase n=1 Tax=Fistulina hepatica ATCC 64428 TaxID=1128425 RepID=A0A0D7A7A7_9AGAR|nr:hypothetical protein FISHEDRAFT_47575 [Fistulina hepatica ATCC 64428]